MSKIYLAFTTVPKRMFAEFNSISRPPRLLLSYFYLGTANRASMMRFSEWVLDSGAYSAESRGKPIKLDDYMRYIMEGVPKLPIGPPTTIFALDVIGDWRASLKNAQTMVGYGIDAVPTFHFGSPMEALKDMAAQFPRIAVGGIARGRPEQKQRFFDECMGIVWPKLVHGFGITVTSIAERTPFDSIDSTTWGNPLRYGYYPRLGGSKMRTSYADSSIRTEVESYLRLEDKLASYWGPRLNPLRAEYLRTFKATPFLKEPYSV